jgi:hypothetical protein
MFHDGSPLQKRIDVLIVIPMRAMALNREILWHITEASARFHEPFMAWLAQYSIFQKSSSL